MASAAMQMTKKMMKEQYAIQGINRDGGHFGPMKMRASSDASMLLLRPEKGAAFTPCGLGILEAEECAPARVRDNTAVMYIHGGGQTAYHLN